MRDIKQIMTDVNALIKADGQEAFGELLKELYGNLSVQAKQYNELEAKATKDEEVIKEIKAKRDELKEQMRTIANKFGIDTESPTWRQALNEIEKGEPGSDEGKKQIENLHKELQEVRDTLKTKAEEQEAALKVARELGGKTMLDRDVRAALPPFKPNPMANDIIVGRVSEQAGYDEDGNYKFINPDGTTKLVNAQPATINDILTEMKQVELDSKKPFLFEGIQASGPTDNRGGQKAEGDYVPGRTTMPTGRSGPMVRVS